MDKPKLWTKDFLLDGAVNFLLYLTFYMLIITITVFATDVLHAAPSEAGLAAGIFIVGALCARAFAGKSIDQFGRKKMLYLGLTAFWGTTALYFGADRLWLLLVVRFLNGAALGIAATATGTIIASIIPHERRGEGTSYYAMSTTLAAAAGPFLGIFLSRHSGYGAIFGTAMALLALGFVGAYFLTVPEQPLTPEQRRRPAGGGLENFIETKAVPIATISALSGFCFSGILSFLTSYTQEIQLVEEGSVFFAVYAASILVSRPLAGRWFDRKGESFVMYPAFLLFAAGLFLLSQAQQGWSLLLAAVCIGVGFGTLSSSAQAIAVKVAPRHRLGLATSTYFVFFDSGIGIGPFFIGLLVPVLGYRGVYASLAAVGAACMVLYHFWHAKKEAAAAEAAA